jgi:anaerobic selenocysteine-containing dehydrogenase
MLKKERKMNQDQTPRRRFLKIGGATLAVIPLMVASGSAAAATNAAMRTALKYQDKPEGDKSCSNCVQFVPGASPQGPGGCKIMAGDTEISPHGYCAAWVKKP